MPSHISEDCQQLITRMLTVDPLQRPSIVDVLKMPIVYNQVQLFTDSYTIGYELSEKIRLQMIDLGIQGPSLGGDQEE